VFHRLHKVCLKLHPQKCFLGRPEVPYLSHVISAGEILPHPGNLLAVKEFPTPTNVRAVREFLGLASYYQRFVPDFGKQVGLVHILIRANVPFLWSESCVETFSQLKELLMFPQCWHTLIFQTHLHVLQTDAIGKGLGAIL